MFQVVIKNTSNEYEVTVQSRARDVMQIDGQIDVSDAYVC